MTKGTAFAIALAVTMPTNLRRSFIAMTPTQILAEITSAFQLSDGDANQLDTTQLVGGDNFLDTSPLAVARFIGPATDYTGTACPTDAEVSQIAAALAKLN